MKAATRECIKSGFKVLAVVVFVYFVIIAAELIKKLKPPILGVASV